MKRALRFASAAALAAAFVLAIAVPALAHAALISSDPADGAQLSSEPSVVTMTFSEAPDPTLSVVHVLTTTAAQVEAGPVAPVPGQSKQLRISMKPGLPDGVYTVSWRVTSAQDGHVTAGAFAFGIGVQPAGAVVPTGAVPPTPGPSALSVVGKVFLYAGLSLLVGAAATGLWAFGGEVPSRSKILIGGGLAAVAGAVAMLLAERMTVGVTMSKLLSSSAGHTYEWLVGATLLAAAVAVVASIRPSNGTLALCGATAAAAMLVRAIGGHAGAEGSAWIQVAFQWIHFLGVGVWIGGFVPVLLLVRQRHKAEMPAPIEQIRRFSFMAGVALFTVVVTGLVRAVSGMGIHDLLHIFSTSYGTTLALKVAVAAALVTLGALNRYRSIPRMADSSGLFLRVISLEVVAAVGVFALTGVLTGLAPRPAPVSTPKFAEVVATGNDVATTVKVRLVVTPGTPGLNAYQVAPTNYDTGAPVPALGLTLRFQALNRPDVAPSSVDLKAGSAGTWVASGTQLSIEGKWQVTAVIQMATTGVEVQMALTTASPAQQVSVSKELGQPDLYTITLAGGIEIQAYNDPGATGPNQLHMTVFDSAGKELPLASATMTAVPPQGVPQKLDARRFSPGHFVASESLTPGDWRFELSATTVGGQTLVASFDQTIT